MIGAGNTIKKDGILFLWKFIAGALIEDHISFKDNLSQTDFSGLISFFFTISKIDIHEALLFPPFLTDKVVYALCNRISKAFPISKTRKKRS
jgi:hypothetical protein